MLAPATDDEGHSSSHNTSIDRYDGRDDADDIYDNEPLILTPPAGKFFDHPIHSVTIIILQISDDGKFPKSRQVLGLMGFLGFANVYAMRVNLSVAVVAMINSTAIPSDLTNDSDVCPMPPITNSTVPRVSFSHSHFVLLLRLSDENVLLLFRFTEGR